MRRVLLLSALLHGVAVAWLAGLPNRALPPAGEPARIEVWFGDAATAAAVQPAAVQAASTDAGPHPRPAAPLSGRTPGLRFAAPDPAVVAAREDPGNRPPPYPADAWARGEQGTVVLRLFIDAAGTVSRLEKLASSGYPSLDAAAERALARWHFLPARRDGRPVASDRTQPVRFVIE